ncbi:MAG: 3-oxoacyl-(acyl-carrier-protein) synthase 2 [Syntrophus sp. PtaU1.Bin005]|nr:MAG: 3-oxoacyl-(acyl-carrier-protein) synthase 2 [Syntrophus sp. PtaU1.Bin005]
MKRRVVITGMGAVTPLGNSVAETWAGICAGRSGIGPITKFDASDFETRIAGELQNFDPIAYVGKKELRRLDPFILYCLASAEMAAADAELTLKDSQAHRAGVVIGSAIGGLTTLEKQKEILLRSGPRKISPFTVPSVLSNLGAGNVSIRFGARGPIGCPVTACASGTTALGDAFRLIASGYADVVFAGGADAAITPMAVAGFTAMGALSRRNDEPRKASRPFDLDRDGFVIGEGCGILILEELDGARARGARIHGEILGYGTTGDAFHLAVPPPGHEGAVRCMQAALQDAGIGPSDVDYVNAHGTSTPLNDRYEVEAIKTVFGTSAGRLLVSSTKSMTGHLLGATGGVEAILTAKALESGIIPPTINLETPDSGFDLDFVPLSARKSDIRIAMSNTFGFGGVNATIILAKYFE